MAEIWECLLMKLTADQYCYAYFCIVKKPAMLKPLSYSSEFMTFHNSIDNASFKADSADVFMSIACFLGLVTVPDD